jgi:hypothetical protein
VLIPQHLFYSLSVSMPAQPQHHARRLLAAEDHRAAIELHHLAVIEITRIGSESNCVGFGIGSPPLHLRVGDQGRGQVLAAPALGRLNQGRGRPLMSTDSSGATPDPALGPCRRGMASPGPARDLSCTAAEYSNEADQHRPRTAANDQRRAEMTSIDHRARSSGRRGHGWFSSSCQTVRRSRTRIPLTSHEVLLGGTSSKTPCSRTTTA